MALLLLLLSALFGLGFLIIRLGPTQFPLRIFCTFYRIRRIVLWVTLAGGVAVLIFAGFPTGGWILVGLQVIFLLVDVITDESRIFRAVENPEFEEDARKSTLDPSAPVLVLEVEGEARAYPMTYVAHHEVINDRIGGKRVVVSFCNQCNVVLSYDATGYARTGGFSTASQYRGNLVMTDGDTHTIWQQITGESLAGTLHPSTLPPVLSRMLPWSEARGEYPGVKLAKTTAGERLPFSLRFFPWERLQRSNYTLGLRQRDRRLPARTPVLGVERIGGSLVYLKEEVAARGWIRNDEVHLLLAVVQGCASGFMTEVDGRARPLTAQGGKITDMDTGSVWNLRGEGLTGPLKTHKLVVWPIHDVFWFAWSDRHTLTLIERVEAEAHRG